MGHSTLAVCERRPKPELAGTQLRAENIRAVPPHLRWRRGFGSRKSDGFSADGAEKRKLTLRTCLHQPCSKGEQYRQSHLGPHPFRFHCAPRVPSSDAIERILASEPVVQGRKRGERVCGEGIVEWKQMRESEGRGGMREKGREMKDGCLY